MKNKQTIDIRDSIPTYKNPVKAIRAKCIDCCCGLLKEIEFCTVKKCALYPFRMGKNPYRTKILTDEQKKTIGERLKKQRSEMK